jgi:hypothetical protein
MHAVRPAAVAGRFYPAQARELRAEVGRCLQDAQRHAPAPGQPRPKLLVVPHAGYVYSGPIAAHAYALLEPWRDTLTRVVLLGPAHRVPVQALAAPRVDAFDTPLGRVPLDTDALDALDDLPQVVRDDQAHAAEHALEVQLPFLQSVLESFTLVPLVVGEASPQEVADVLERLWGGPETLIVISSDLSHYLSYDEAGRIDRDTVQRITAIDADVRSDLRGDQACGARALNGALRALARHGLQGRVLDLRNSGDTAGDHRRVVGYAAIAFAEPAEKGRSAQPQPDTDRQAGLGDALVATARQAIAQRLGVPAPQTSRHPALDERGASFVTLHDRGGQLRGCIGTLTARQPLGEDVRQHALAAAFDDPRFAPLAAAEWPGLQVEVSVLTDPQPMPVADEADLLARLRPGVDGVVLQWRGRHATFLPQVWEQLPEPRTFIAALKRKAGLAPEFWADDIRIERYEVRKYGQGQGA